MLDKTLSIAGVNFSLLCPDNVIVEEKDISYRPFWGQGINNPAAINITIQLLLDKMPDLTGGGNF